MATKIRLARHGRKRKPFYHIVVADGRAPRDGRFIEKLGTYNPNTNPATIDVDFDRAVAWLEKGAQPTDTTKAILSYQGALLRVHLNQGVAKGAMTQEQADAKFDAWKADKSQLVETKVGKLKEVEESKLKASMEAETSRRQSIQERIDAKLTPAVEEVEITEEVVDEVEAVTEEVVSAEVPATEEVQVEAEAPKAEAEISKAEVETSKAEVETSKAEAETPKAEAETETPAEEAATPAEDSTEEKA